MNDSISKGEIIHAVNAEVNKPKKVRYKLHTPIEEVVIEFDEKEEVTSIDHILSDSIKAWTGEDMGKTELSKVDFRTDKSANIGTEVNDLISRADAIEAVQKIVPYVIDKDTGRWGILVNKANIITELEALTSAERNCFTCGMENGVMKFNPENVSDEVIEANDRTVKLSDVCKFIKANFELNPKQWGELQDLPSAEAEWIPCSERLPKTGDSVLATYSDGEVDIIWSARPKVWVTCSERNNLIYPIAWMPLPKPYKGGAE